jgi:hypothetical protein
MSKSRLDPFKIDPEIVKEYQNIIRKLQEELYNLKNSSAVQEEISSSLKQSESYLQSEIV